MKDVKIADIRAESADQLQDRLVGLKKEQFNLRFQQAAGQLEGTSRVRQVRREIARIKTVQGEAARGVVVAPKAASTPAKPAKKAAAAKGKK